MADNFAQKMKIKKEDES